MLAKPFTVYMDCLLGTRQANVVCVCLCRVVSSVGAVGKGCVNRNGMM